MSLSETSAIPYRRQLHRRLNSCNDTEPVYPQTSAVGSAHSRSKTEKVQHPLGKGPQFNSSTITRPNLARAMGDGPQHHDGYSSHGKGKGRAEEYEETIRHTSEKAVIVHEISSTDSLAGIALKYGLSVPELCRANGMWPKDPIHLRQVLYIPLDKSAKYMLEPLVDLSEGVESTENTEDLQMNLKQSSIQRIPEWKLSFFPPPSNMSSHDKPPDPSRTPNLKHPRYPTIHAPSNTSSPPLHSLSNLFSSIPIVARLSLDSTTTSSDDAELELDHVRPEQQHHLHTSIDHTHQNFNSPSKSSMRRGPKSAHRAPSIPVFASPSSNPIRTSQLAPQPDMLLPLAPRPHSRALATPRAPTEVSS